MPKPELTVEPDATVDTTLLPAQAALLRQTCREYQTLDAQIKVLTEKRDGKKAVLGQIRDAAGVQSLQFEGWKVTLVGGLRKVLNKKRLFALGCKKEWLDEAEELKPSKPYEKITLPGQSHRSDSDDE